ncbi:MAG: hypothetical protein ACOYOQ_16150 [Microthrixaceae bacterium]
MTNNEESFEQLNPKQWIALEALLSGLNQRQAADQAGVSREQVNRWLNHHPGFVAEFNRRVNERLEARTVRRDLLEDRALDTIEGALNDGNASVALALLKLLQAQPRPAPGPATVDEVISAKVAARTDQIQRLEPEGGPPGPEVAPPPNQARLREIVVNEMRAGLDLPPENGTPEAGHWTYSGCELFSALVAADNDQAAREIRDSGQPDTHHDDVVVITPLNHDDLQTLVALFDRPASVVPEAPGLAGSSDASSIRRVDPTLVAALGAIPERQTQLLARRWADSIEPAGWINELEAERLIKKLRWAFQDGRRRKWYLWLDERCPDEQPNPETGEGEPPADVEQAA